MVRINLLPVRVSKKKEAGKQQLVLFAVLLVGGLVMNWLWADSRASDLAAREAKVKSTREEIKRLDRIIGEVKNVKDQQAALRDKLAVLDKLKAGRSGPVRMLDELATITPKRVWLRKLEEHGGGMLLEGTAATIDDVSEFMTALKTAKYFTGVELKRTTARDQGSTKLVEFTLTTGVRYTVPAPDASAAAGAPPPAASPKKSEG